MDARLGERSAVVCRLVMLSDRDRCITSCRVFESAGASNGPSHGSLLLALPPELLEKVAGGCGIAPVVHLAASCRELHDQLDRLLAPKREAARALLARRKAAQPSRLKRVFAAIVRSFWRALIGDVDFLEGVSFGYDPDADESLN